jgi:hypothetical protein
MDPQAATSLANLLRYAVVEAQVLGRKDVADVLLTALDSLTRSGRSARPLGHTRAGSA